mmetsp:Transcript_11614/g.11487  ORF Transcript_11614/g.11487 Transcript_11614/m.11487 type:complete len:154 (+) Transcript_11614:42-503(+)
MGLIITLLIPSILLNVVETSEDGSIDPSVLGGDVREFEKSYLHRLAHIYHKAATSVIPNTSTATSASSSFASFPDLPEEPQHHMKYLYTLLLVCMLFIAAMMCVRIHRAEANRRSRRSSSEMSKSLMQYPSTTTDAGDGDTGNGRSSAYYRVL